MFVFCRTLLFKKKILISKTMLRIWNRKKNSVGKNIAKLILFFDFQLFQNTCWQLLMASPWITKIHKWIHLLILIWVMKKFKDIGRSNQEMNWLLLNIKVAQSMSYFEINNSYNNNFYRRIATIEVSSQWFEVTIRFDCPCFI